MYNAIRLLTSFVPPSEFDVMHFLGQCYYSMPFASFAERVSCKVRRTDFSPDPVVPFRIDLAKLLRAVFFQQHPNVVGEAVVPFVRQHRADLLQRDRRLFLGLTAEGSEHC